MLFLELGLDDITVNESDNKEAKLTHVCIRPLNLPRSVRFKQKYTKTLLIIPGNDIKPKDISYDGYLYNTIQFLKENI